MPIVVCKYVFKWLACHGVQLAEALGRAYAVERASPTIIEELDDDEDTKTLPPQPAAEVHVSLIVDSSCRTEVLAFHSGFLSG